MMLTTEPTRHAESERNSSRLRKLAAGFLVLAGLIQPAMAAGDKPEARHYTVEMIIFSYEQTDNNLSESWPENAQVELPDAYLPLYRPNDITPEILAKTEQTLQARAQTNEAGEQEVVKVPVGPVPLSRQQRVDLESKRLPELFLMPQEHLQLKDQRYRLERRNQFRILYHEAWTMPVYDRENSLPIMIRGGEQYDNLPELEGSIRLSVARYLHLDTNLYLREFAASQSEGQSHVPRFNELLNQKKASSVILKSSQVNHDASMAMLGLRQYRVDQVIPLKQSRRMRSGDLHYIDHPRYGILIQLTPYDPDQEPIKL